MNYVRDRWSWFQDIGCLPCRKDGRPRFLFVADAKTTLGDVEWLLQREKS